MGLFYTYEVGACKLALKINFKGIIEMQRTNFRWKGVGIVSAVEKAPANTKMAGENIYVRV